MRFNIFFSLIIILLSGCASNPQSTVLYKTECGKFGAYGIPHACECFYNDGTRQKLGENWEPMVLECRATAGLPGNEEIRSMTEAEACSNRFDPEVADRISRKGFICDDSKRACRDSGYRIGTSKFDKCVEMNERAKVDPSFLYCLERGFKFETEKFSTCTVEADRMFAQIHQNNMMLNAIERQRVANEQARRAEAWRAFGQSLLNSAPAPRHPSTTTCREVLPGQVNCTSW